MIVEPCDLDVLPALDGIPGDQPDRVERRERPLDGRQPAPADVEYTGSVADPAEIESFVAPMHLCR